jgi:arabinofuranosyltransferase
MKYSSIWGRFFGAADGRAAAVVVILAVLLIAIANAFVTDDAFISFRYARNLVERHELTWNPGMSKPTEGYSNFLWTLIMAAAIEAGIDPVRASEILGLLFALGTLLVTYGLAARLLRSRRWALLTIALLGANYTFLAFATSGLETQMQTFLVAACASLAFRVAEKDRWSIPRAAGLSLLAAAAILTRLDSGIPVFVLFVYLLFSEFGHAAKENGDASGGAFPGSRIAAWTALAAPVLLIVGAWMLWRHGYYHRWLPNSYYAKASMFSLDILKGGLLYLFEFFRSYCLLPIVFLFLFLFRKVFDGLEMDALAWICGLWFLYIVRVGGDFMEFRFIVPVLPILFIVTAATLRALERPKIQAALVTMLLACSLFHGATFRGTPGVEPISKLRDYISNDGGRWKLVGEKLRELFPEGDVTIATTAAGAIPYYSKLPTIDMLGMNDTWVARRGAIIGPRPGHRRAATLAYLDDRGVNLVIGHPIVEPVDAKQPAAGYRIADLGTMFMIQNATEDYVPFGARIVEIPLDAGHRLTVLYLLPNRRVEALIMEGRLTALPVARS